MNLEAVSLAAERLWPDVAKTSFSYWPIRREDGQSNAKPKTSYPEELRFEISEGDLKSVNAEDKPSERGTTRTTRIRISIRKSEFPPEYKITSGDKLIGETDYTVVSHSLDSTLPGFEIFIIEAEHVS